MEANKGIKRKIKESFRKWYKWIKRESYISGYMRKGWGKADGEGWQDLGWEV